MCKHSGVKTKYTHAITLRLFVFLEIEWNWMNKAGGRNLHLCWNITRSHINTHLSVLEHLTESYRHGSRLQPDRSFGSLSANWWVIYLWILFRSKLFQYCETHGIKGVYFTHFVQLARLSQVLGRVIWDFTHFEWSL